MAALAGCVSVAWFGGLGSRALAQQPGGMQPPPSMPIAHRVIDINAIFKMHAGFKEAMSRMKEDARRAEREVKEESDSIKKFVESVKDYRPGTAEYKAVEEKVVARQSELELRVRRQKRGSISARRKSIARSIRKSAARWTTTATTTASRWC